MRLVKLWLSMGFVFFFFFGCVWCGIIKIRAVERAFKALNFRSSLATHFTWSLFRCYYVLSDKNI